MQGASPLASPGLNPGGIYRPCRCDTRRGGAGGLAPARHLLVLPRGRGPSQTPKFLSPGPPSPWLPAPLIGKCLCRFCGELAMPKASPCRMPDWQVEPVSPGQAPRWAPAWQVLQVPQAVKCRGCKGRSPLHKKTKNPPFPAGEGGWGDRGQNNKPKAG